MINCGNDQCGWIVDLVVLFFYMTSDGFNFQIFTSVSLVSDQLGERLAFEKISTSRVNRLLFRLMRSWQCLFCVMLILCMLCFLEVDRNDCDPSCYPKL